MTLTKAQNSEAMELSRLGGVGAARRYPEPFDCARGKLRGGSDAECCTGPWPTNRDERPHVSFPIPQARERNLLLLLFFAAKADSSSVAAATSLTE